MNKVVVLILFLFSIFVAICKSTSGQVNGESPHLLFENKMGEKMDLRLYTRTANGMLKPEKSFENGEKKMVKFPFAENYYVVLIDSKRRKDRLGWFSFYNEAKNSPGATVDLEALYVDRKKFQTVTKMRKETKSRQVPVTTFSSQTKTRSVPVYDSNTGQTKYVTQEYVVKVPYTTMIVQQYTVNVPYQEQKAIVVKEKTGILKLVRKDGSITTLKNTGEIEADDFPFKDDELEKIWDVPRLGVKFFICPTGIHISYVDPSGPASRCLSPTGKVIRLQAGDHLVSINGVVIDTVEKMGQVIGNSSGKIVISIIDKNTNNRVKLSAILN